MKVPRVVVADIDGTLLTDKKVLTPFTKEVLNTLHRNGVLFVIASGKPCFQTKILNKEDWHLDFEIDGLIGMNGGELYDHKTDTISTSDLLSKETIKEIVELMKDVEDANCMIYKNEHILYTFKDETSEISGKRNGLPVDYIKDISEFWEYENAKVLFRFNTVENCEKAKEYLSQFKFDKYYYFNSQTTMLEFTDPHINKINGLKKFCAQKGIAVEDCIAFGDMTNDNEMLKGAGIGVCLCNGDEETKKCADYITEYDNNHDGLAHFIYENIIIPNNLK